MPSWLTAELPGSGGVLEPSPADFVVEERLAYPPSGAGEHAFLEIEKTGITTNEAVARVAETLGFPRRLVGAAGLKDKSARARQTLSFPWPVKQPLPRFDLDGPELRVLALTRHGNKLKRSHGRGNRFEITVRAVPEGGAARAAAVLARLAKTGVPNAFGPQRFGRDADNAVEGLAIARGERPPPRDRRVASILISAVQSEVFNKVLALRIERGLIDRALAGDVMKKHDTGGLFDVDDPAVEQPRVDRLEISPTAALPGPKARTARGVPQSIEDEALTACGLTAADVERLDVGTRRALRYPLDPEARIEPVDASSYRLIVELPAGSFATVLLAELMKPESGVVLRAE